jgi:hypothetical protein
MSGIIYNPSSLVIPRLLVEAKQENPFTQNNGHGMILVCLVRPGENEPREVVDVINPRNGELTTVHAIRVRSKEELKGREVIGLAAQHREFEVGSTNNEFPIKAEMIHNCLAANAQWLDTLPTIQLNTLIEVCKDLNARMVMSKKKRTFLIPMEPLLQAAKRVSIPSGFKGWLPRNREEATAMYADPYRSGVSIWGVPL